MAMPAGVSILSIAYVLELSVEQLKVELESRYLEARGLNKPQMQKALIKSWSLEAPIVVQSRQEPTPLTAQHQMELDVLKLRLQAEASEKKKRQEADERKELREREREALDRKVT